MNPTRKRKAASSNLASRKKRRTEPDLRVTVTPSGTRSVQVVRPEPVPDLRVTVTPDGRRSVRLGRPTATPDLSVTVTPDGTRTVQLRKPTPLARTKRDLRDRTAPVTIEKRAASPATDDQPMPVEEPVPVKETPTATTTIATQHEPPVPMATYSYATDNPHLKPDNDRLQVIVEGGNWLWHRSHPDCYILADGRTGEFIKYDGTPTGEYFSKANLFEKKSPDYGDQFWLTYRDERYDAQNYEVEEPDDENAQKVPWGHLVQHLYDHFTDFSIKEAHTFWPPGTTEANLLDNLVSALNHDDAVDAVKKDEETFPAHVRRGPNKAIKTFFLDRSVAEDDKFTPDQLSDLGDLIG
ncbi:MAG TPA: hypothetical protein VGR06_03595 [Actinophytocola sp.]|jgi:hypothetical protein|uniref:hypothetical protein n=1 Tax=Actinophytocola sp. TaxID=1872138 RepID=UPI002DFD3F8C|nr:hypothetical protein [Actinophytocola sp.]